MKDPYIPPLEEAIFTHSIRHLEAELETICESSVFRKFSIGESVFGLELIAVKNN